VIDKQNIRLRAVAGSPQPSLLQRRRACHSGLCPCAACGS